jgi:hypothetical protein
MIHWDIILVLECPICKQQTEEHLDRALANPPECAKHLAKMLVIKVELQEAL